jgi:hypothetical protein
MRTFAIVLFGGLLVGCSDDGGGGDTAPAAPANLDVEQLGDGAHLTWDDVSDNEDEFMIMRKEDDGVYEEITRVTFNTEQFHDEPLDLGTIYTYMVMAVNDAGDAGSNEVDFELQ